MFGKKQKSPSPNPPRRKGAALMEQMGLGGYSDMSQMENDMYGDLENDQDLEAELAMLQGDDPPPRTARSKPKPQMVDFSELEKLANADVEINDDDLSDTEDPDLLAELENLSASGIEELIDAPAPAGISPSEYGKPGTDVIIRLQDRITMYKEAVDNAKSNSDTSKERRLGRGLKTLEDMLKKAKSGKAIDESEIPPVVAVKTKSVASDQTPAASGSASASSVPDNQPIKRPLPSPKNRSADGQPGVTGGPLSSAKDRQMHNMLCTRRDQYKQAALEAKKQGDMARAKENVKISKQFDTVIGALKEGKAIDLSKMPPPPPGVGQNAAPRLPPPSRPAPQPLSVNPPEVRVERASHQATGATGGEAEPIPEYLPQPSAEEEKQLFKAPDAPSSVIEALNQRLEKYKSAEEQAKAEGNTSKGRRMGRIVKQYQDAIKAHKAGKPVNYDELPTPPGFAPIPSGSTPSPPQGATGGATSARQVLSPPGVAPKPGPPSPPKQPRPAVSPGQQRKRADAEIARIESVKKGPSSRAEQQEAFLKERMEEFKAAAIDAKKNGDIELAKKYLRLHKGCEPMLQALQSGLPVDLAQVPPPPPKPDEEDSFMIVAPEDCEPGADRDEMYKKLEQALIQQVRTCATNNQHYTKLGDVASAAKFQKMEQNCRKDLDSLKNAFRHGDPVPKFHYETKSFSMVRSNTDLGENDCEIRVVRGIQYNPPSGYSPEDVSTYVKWEFPFPNEEPQSGQTETCKHTCNPEYDEHCKLQINRKARTFARVVEKKVLKLEVFYKRGFLKGDKVLGTASLKLLPLESQCTLHESLDLMEGRKTIGGKLEVKLRIRDPLKGKQVDEVKEKWLVIDKFLRTLDPKPQMKRSKSEGSSSMEVLRFEKQQLDKQISYLKDNLSEGQKQALTHKSNLLQEKMEQQQKALKEGGTPAWKAYVLQLEADSPAYEEEARQLARQGDMQKAQIVLTKKRLVDKELDVIRKKILNTAAS
ncbi:coiled-coil and C2 domain-containing protein 1-like isoform X2 [Liolophura sinensis]|uniref:coiled-coil and C2 domain-containing protein 1-like isoform X2 n=1 Tax=Liolophura sinensis TaxID=3198878 RepID=UPI003158D830